jgi:hypothetical protein
MPGAGSVSLLAAFRPTDTTDYAPTQLTRTLTVTQASSSVSIATSNSSVVANTSVTFTATVLPQIGGVPTGSVTFYDGSTTIGLRTLSSGAASMSTTGLAVGTHNITASYSGDSNFTRSTSTTAITQTVTDDLVVSPLALDFSLQPVGATSAAQTVTLANNLVPAITISGITLTGAGANQFAQTTNCGATLASGTSCSISVTFAPQVVGSPSAQLLVSDSATNSPQSVTLNGTVRRGTPILSWSAPLPITYGTLLTATQLDATASVPGTLTYTPTANTMPGAGSVSLLAYFKPTDATDYAPAQLTRTLTVNQASTSVIVATNNISVVANTSVTFTATVQPQIGGSPTGTVTFYDGSASIGIAAVSAGAQASISIASLALGAHTITAVYPGDTNFTANTSTPLTETITAPPATTDFTFTASGSATQTVSAGQAATFQFALAPTAATFANPVTFSGTGLPTGATASFSPATLAAGSAAPAAPVTMTVLMPTSAHVPSGPVGPNSQQALHFPSTRITGVCLLCLLLFLSFMPAAPVIRNSPGAPRFGAALLNFVFARKASVHSPASTRLRPSAAFLALMLWSVIAFCASGCASPTVPASTSYSVTVTAASGTVSHAITVTLTLK